MDINRLDKIAKENLQASEELSMEYQTYYIAVRGLYSQYKNGEISLNQVRKEKERIVRWYEEGQEFSKQIVHLNKDKVVEAVILELGRYMSCGQNHEQREKAYPRKLFEERIVKVIDQAYNQA